MGANWISWSVTVIITVLQIQGGLNSSSKHVMTCDERSLQLYFWPAARISVRTTSVTGVKGQGYVFKCKYENGQQNNTKYFCYDSGDKMFNTLLIRTEKHDQWDSRGRFSLYDNTTGAFFIVSVDKLALEDSGTYRCGVDVSSLISFIQLNVSQVTGSPIPPEVLTVNKIHLSLFVTAAMCLGAILFICLFTLCLLLAVNHRRPGPRNNRETSSDYETMMPGPTTEPDLSCSFSEADCTDWSALPPPSADLCRPLSTVTLGHVEYVDMDELKHSSEYECLDLSQLEKHIYSNIHARDPKDGPLGVKEEIMVEG